MYQNKQNGILNSELKKFRAEILQGRVTSGSLQAVFRQSSLQAVINKSSASHLEIIRQSSGSIVSFNLKKKKFRAEIKPVMPF